MSLLQTLQGNLAAIRQTTLIEVELGNNPQQNQGITFGNQNSLLDNAVITSIECFNSTLLTTAPSGAPVITAGDIPKLTCTLVDLSAGKNFEFVKDYPLYNLVTSNNAGIVKEILFRRITLNKCKINIVDTTVTPNTSVVLAFNYWTKAQYQLFMKQMGSPDILFKKPGLRGSKTAVKKTVKRR